MKKLKLFFALFAMLATFGISNAWGAEVFKETFAKSTGTSGFSGSAANGTFVADNNGWTHQNPYGAGGAAKFGASKKIGEAETPSISCGNGVTSATLTFKAGAWSGDAKTLKLSYTNCSGAASVTLTDAAWSDYTVELTNITGDIKIKFTGNATSKARFFLDDVIVTVIESSGGDEPETPATDLTDAQFAWSAATAEATMGASNTFPTLTNTLPVSVTYESSNTAAATIAADGTITLVAPGTTTISAKFAGGEVSGTTYAAKTVKYDLTVLKAPATPTENVYVKVTETAGITDGEYLIVYEDAEGNPKAPVAFDGSLATLDAAGNMMSVTITDNVINGNTEIDEVTFNISAMTGGYAIKSKSGKYIGRTSSGNGMNTGASEFLNIITITDGKTTISGSGDGASTSLQYYSVSGSERFRYYGSNQKPIALYKKVDPSEILAPAFSVAAGSFYGAQSVVITCATPGAEIYYTLDGSTPSSTSTKYTSAVAISETKTLKAIAIKGEYSSSVTEATYTILAPLATMQEIFDKATAVGGTATPVKVTMNNWVVTGVKGSNAYLTDGTKGLIIYTASHGFVVGDALSGTVACKVQLYDGSAELTSLTKTTEGLTVTTGGTITPVVVNDVTTLNGVNTGSVIQITGVCETKTINDKLYYYVADIQLYNSLFAYTNPTVGKKYNVTGVYLQYGEVEEILPRKQEDIEEVQDLATATISVSNISLEVDETKTIEATITPDAAKTTVKYTITAGSENVTLNGATITGVKEGTATITATIAEAAGEYYGTTKDFTVTVTPKSSKDNIVVLAKYGDQWYAMMAQYVSGKTSHLAALPVSYVGGKLYNVADADKALIEWTRAVVDGKATFSNNSKYLTGKSDKTDLTLAATSCDWTISGESYLMGERTFFYNAENNWFRNFKIENVDAKNYSGMPVVTAPVYTTGTLYTIKATAENGTVVGAGVYVAGDKVTLTADPAMDYTFVNWTVGGAEVSTANPYVFTASEDLELVANFAKISQTSKTLSGKFSTGEHEYAEFATGNLQYNTENKTWRFAKQQYQYVGEANINIGDPNYKGWIDMLGWSNGDANNFGVNPSCNKDLYVGEFVDWGNMMGEGWETLSHEQWDYLLNKRGAGKKQIARVGTVFGVLLFPDEWEMPSGISVTEQDDDYFKVKVYNYTLDQWAALENAGALFLPAAGRRFGGYGNTVQVTSDGKTALQYGTNYFAAYWTSTKHSDGERASYLINLSTKGENNFVYSNFTLGWYEYGYVGQSVRLAKVTDITPVVIRDGLTVGQWGTLCPTQNVATPTGATFYQIAYLEEKDGLPFNMYFDQIKATTLTAGEPYFFIASATEIKGVKSGEVKTAGDNANGFYGYIDETDAPWELPFEAEYDVNKDNTFVIWNNSVFRINAATKIKSERCYIIINKTQPSRDAVSVPAGARRITMGVSGINGQNTATGMENVDASAQPVKTIINGQLYILRGEKMYDAQGKLVK